MATITTFVDGKNQIELVAGRVHYAEALLDFSKTNVKSADVVQALKIPDKALIIDQLTEVVTAEGAAATADIGDTADPNGHDAAVDLNVAAHSATLRGTDAYAVGIRLAADGTIDFIPNADLDTAVVRIQAAYMMLET